MDPTPLFAPRDASADPAEAPSSADFNQQENLALAWEDHFKAQALASPGPTGVKLALPSGMKVRAIRPHLMVLMREGKIPDALTPLVEKLIAMLQNGIAEAPIKAVMKEYEEDEAAAYERFMSLLDTNWVNAVVEPVFVRNPATQRGLAKPGEKVFPVSAVSMDDKLFLFQWCQGVSDDLAAFRAGQDRVLEAVSRGKNVFDLAVDLARNRSAQG